MTLVLSFAWLAIVTWLIIRACDQRDSLRVVNPVRASETEGAPTLAVVIPARDEEANIGPCLHSLLEQSYPSDRVRILVVDDHSADATASIATSQAEAHPQLSVICSPPLPLHWTGKSHACWIGAHQVPKDTEWLCFMDADTRAERDLLASAVATATSERLDFLSLAPRQELVSFAERMIMPCGLYFLGFYQNLSKLQSNQLDDATATGQFMLVRCSAYREIGGHEAVHSAISEDRALARLLKRCGRRVVLYDGRQLISTRMYTGWRTLWPGLAKNLIDILGGPLPTIAAAVAAVILSWAAWLIPIWSGVGCAQGVPGACMSLLPALAGSGAALGLHIAGAAYFCIPLWYGLLFPIGYTVGAAIAVDSVLRRLRGRVSWKGRIYS